AIGRDRRFLGLLADQLADISPPNPGNGAVMPRRQIGLELPRQLGAAAKGSSSAQQSIGEVPGSDVLESVGSHLCGCLPLIGDRIDPPSKIGQDQPSALTSLGWPKFSGPQGRPSHYVGRGCFTHSPSDELSIKPLHDEVGSGTPGCDAQA